MQGPVTVAADAFTGRGGAEAVFMQFLRLQQVTDVVIGLLATDPPAFHGNITTLARRQPWTEPEHLSVLEHLLEIARHAPLIRSCVLVSHHHAGLLIPTMPTRTVYYLHTPTRFLWEPGRVPWEPQPWPASTTNSGQPSAAPYRRRQQC